MVLIMAVLTDNHGQSIGLSHMHEKNEYEKRNRGKVVLELWSVGVGIL